MKTKSLFAAGMLLMLILLAGCTVEYNTKVNGNQSGALSMAVGFSADEVKALAAQSTTTSGSVCDQMFKDSSTKLPANTTTRKEMKGTETWCYVDLKFTDLLELKKFYQDENATVNRLEVVNGIFFYDVSMDMGSADSSIPTGYPLTFTWKLTLPGAVKSNNADLVNGNTLSWNLGSATGVVDMTAESSTNGSTPGWIWWVVGSLCCLCLVVLVIAALVGLIVYLRRRNKPEVVTPAAQVVDVAPAAEAAPVTPLLKKPARSKKA
jgi:hypothetical protein